MQAVGDHRPFLCLCCLSPSSSCFYLFHTSLGAPSSPQLRWVSTGEQFPPHPLITTITTGCRHRKALGETGKPSQTLQCCDGVSLLPSLFQTIAYFAHLFLGCTGAGGGQGTAPSSAAGSGESPSWKNGKSQRVSSELGSALYFCERRPGARRLYFGSSRAAVAHSVSSAFAGGRSGHG